MSIEVKTVSNESFNKLCEIAKLTDEQESKCKSLSVSCDKLGLLEVKVEYYVTEEINQ